MHLNPGATFACCHGPSSAPLSSRSAGLCRSATCAATCAATHTLSLFVSVSLSTAAVSPSSRSLPREVACHGSIPPDNSRSPAMQLMPCRICRARSVCCVCCLDALYANQGRAAAAPLLCASTKPRLPPPRPPVLLLKASLSPPPSHRTVLRCPTPTHVSSVCAETTKQAASRTASRSEGCSHMLAPAPSRYGHQRMNSQGPWWMENLPPLA
jgi:hypothetical protein